MKLLTEIYAIDIGTSAIKLVELKKGKSADEYSIAHAEISELPYDLVGGDCTTPYISDLNKFKDILRNLVKKAGNPDKEVIMALPDRWVKLYLLDIVIPENEVGNDNFLKWKIEKQVPLAEDFEIMLDYVVLNADMNLDDDVELHVCAAAVKKEIIEILAGITADMKLEVLNFNTSSLGLFNIYEEIYKESPEGSNVINLHIGHETTVVKAYEQGSLAYERVIEVAGEEFSKIISEADECDVETATKTKHNELFFPVTRSDVVELNKKRARIEKIFDNWLRELNVTFSFFKRKFHIASLPPIFITGGGAMFKGIDVFLSEFLETKCSVFNPFIEIKEFKDVNDILKTQGAIYAACLGQLCM